MSISNPIDKILSVATDNDNQCWLWHTTQSRLYRTSWEAHNAMPVPPGMVVRHICDQARCLNPFHLTVGTQQDNMTDRRNRPKPKKARGSYLSDAERLAIMTSSATAADLASEYLVSERLINVLRKRWSSFSQLQRALFTRKVKGS